MVEAGLAVAGPVALPAVPRQGDQQHGGGALPLTQTPGDLPPVQAAGQADVQQDGVGAELPGGFQGGGAVRGQADLLAGQAEEHRQALPVVRAIVNDQNA